MSRIQVTWAQLTTPATGALAHERAQVDGATVSDHVGVQLTPTEGIFEVATGKMLNARFATNTYTDHWIYVSTDGENFTHTYDDPQWTSTAHGKLFNARMVQAAYEHEGGSGYPEPFDPAANTAAFIAALPDYRAYGVLGVTVGCQGGNPNFASNGSGNEVSAFASDGSLKVGSGTFTAPQPGTWGDRLKQILDATRALQMVTILNLFYHGQDQRLADNDAVRHACDQIVDFCVANNYRHVIFDVANEYDISGSSPLGWQRSVLSNNGSGSITGDSDEIAGLILRIQQRYTNHHGLDWRAPVGTSMSGRPTQEFTNNLKLYSDVCLPHGNVLDDWEDEEEDTYAHMVALRNAIDSGPNPGIPIIMNEDDNKRSSAHGYVNDTNLGEEIHALNDCINADVSWGFMVDFYTQKYDMGLDEGWWGWSVGTPGVEESSRTEADYLADVLQAIFTALSTGDTVRGAVDAAGATDVAGQAVTHQRGQVDAAGATDLSVVQAAGGQEHIRARIDNAGASDLRDVVHVVPTPGIRILRVVGSDDRVYRVDGSFTVPKLKKLALPLGSDFVVEMRLVGSGSIAGYTFRAHVAEKNSLDQDVLSGTPEVYDAANRLVRWTLSAAELAPGAGGVPERAAKGYRWAIWRDDSGADVPLVYGDCEFVELPGSHG